MATALGTLKEGEAVRLHCLSRAFTAEVTEVRTSMGGLSAMVALVTRDHVPKREMPPGQRVAIYAADGSRWEGAIGGSMDSAASIILQQSTGPQQKHFLDFGDEPETSRARMDIPSAVCDRTDYLWRANIAKKFGKYDEMLSAVNDIAALHMDLNSEEKKLLISCYNCLLKQNWQILKVLRSCRVDNLEHVSIRVVREFTEKIGHQLLEQCNDALGFIEERLLPFSSERNIPFYYKMMGDISWLALDVESDDRHDLVKKATSYYEMAIDVMLKTNASSTDSVFLEVILNLSALLHDVVNSKSRARTLAMKAVAAASGRTQSLESKAVLDLLHQNLDIWLSQEIILEADELADQTLTEEIIQDAEQAMVPLGAPDHLLAQYAVNEDPEDAEQAVVPLGAPDHLLAQDAVNEDPEDAEQAVVPLGAPDHLLAQDAVNEDPEDAEQAVVPLGAPDHLLAQDAVNEDLEAAQQVVVLHEVIDVPPDPEVANVALPVPEPVGAQPVIPHLPQDYGVPMVFREVERPAPLQFESPPVDKKNVGNAWHGKKFRLSMKAKSVEKSKYG